MCFQPLRKNAISEANTVTTLTAPNCVSLRSSHSKIVMEFICKQQRDGNTNTHEEKGKTALGCPQQRDPLNVLVPSPSEGSFQGRPLLPHYTTPKSQGFQAKAEPSWKQFNRCIPSIGQITLWILCGKSLFSLIVAKYT